MILVSKKVRTKPLKSWRQIARKTIYSTPYIKLYEDVIDIGDNKVVNDFSVVEFRDGVVIVATDTNGMLISIDEYKYAVNKTLRILPAGGIEDGDTPEVTAAKELREETGYEGEGIEIIGRFYEYPSKLSHSTYVVRIYNAKQVQAVEHETTESISDVHLLDFTEDIIDKFETSINNVALHVALKKK